MNGQGVGQVLFFVGALVVLAYPLGRWLARVYGSFRGPRPLQVVEAALYRAVRTYPFEEQSWQGYARSALVFGGVCTFVLYVLQRLQGVLFLNPDGQHAVSPPIALNTSVSFVTNTSWQLAAASVGTLRIDGATFAALVGLVVVTSGLMVLPALSLGPIVEGLAH
jgi:potassium-transporting ATPase potassium-binding subunit